MDDIEVELELFDDQNYIEDIMSNMSTAEIKLFKEKLIEFLK